MNQIQLYVLGDIVMTHSHVMRYLYILQYRKHKNWFNLLIEE